MRKTPRYTQRQQTGTRAMNAMSAAMARCTPYETNKVFKYQDVLLRIHTSLQGFLDRTLPSSDTAAYDDLVQAVGEAQVRWLEIGGSKDNPALPILHQAGNALIRTRARWERTGQWGLDGPAMQEIKDGIALYEQVLMISSPQQMYDAAMTREKWLKEQNRNSKLSALMEQRVKEVTHV